MSPWEKNVADPNVASLHQIRRGGCWLSVNETTEYLGPGALVLVQKLTEVLVVELVRDNFGRNEVQGYLRALNDIPMSRALQQLHATPEADWTLASLAKDVGVSPTKLEVLLSKI